MTWDNINLKTLFGPMLVSVRQSVGRLIAGRQSTGHSTFTVTHTHSHYCAFHLIKRNNTSENKL